METEDPSAGTPPRSFVRVLPPPPRPSSPASRDSARGFVIWVVAALGLLPILGLTAKMLTAPVDPRRPSGSTPFVILAVLVPLFLYSVWRAHRSRQCAWLLRDGVEVHGTLTGREVHFLRRWEQGPLPPPAPGVASTAVGPASRPDPTTWAGFVDALRRARIGAAGKFAAIAALFAVAAAYARDGSVAGGVCGFNLLVAILMLGRALLREGWERALGASGEVVQAVPVIDHQRSGHHVLSVTYSRAGRALTCVCAIPAPFAPLRAASDGGVPCVLMLVDPARPGRCLPAVAISPVAPR